MRDQCLEESLLGTPQFAQSLVLISVFSYKRLSEDSVSVPGLTKTLDGELLGIHDPPASASLVPGTTGYFLFIFLLW